MWKENQQKRFLWAVQGKWVANTNTNRIFQSNGKPLAWFKSEPRSWDRILSWHRGCLSRTFGKLSLLWWFCDLRLKVLSRTLYWLGHRHLIWWLQTPVVVHGELENLSNGVWNILQTLKINNLKNLSHAPFTLYALNKEWPDCRETNFNSINLDKISPILLSNFAVCDQLSLFFLLTGYWSGWFRRLQTIQELQNSFGWEGS